MFLGVQFSKKKESVNICVLHIVLGSINGKGDIRMCFKISFHLHKQGPLLEQSHSSDMPR